MALLLFAREIANGGRFRKGSPNVQAVDRLIEEAHEKCLARFNWSVARSDAATGYALAAVLVEALSQAIETFGYPIEPLNSYLAENRARLIVKGAIGTAERDKLSYQGALSLTHAGDSQADENLIRRCRHMEACDGGSDWGSI